MLRKEVEEFMRAHNMTQIDIIYNENDNLGIYCTLGSNGTLKDYTNHVVNRKKDIWGYIHWINGSPERRKFDETRKSSK